MTMWRSPVKLRPQGPSTLTPKACYFHLYPQSRHFLLGLSLDIDIIQPPMAAFPFSTSFIASSVRRPYRMGTVCTEPHLGQGISFFRNFIFIITSYSARAITTKTIIKKRNAQNPRWLSSPGGAGSGGFPPACCPFASGHPQRGQKLTVPDARMVPPQRGQTTVSGEGAASSL